MNTSPSTSYALRSLWRNPRRTILSTVGIAVGVAICLLMTGFMEGGMGQFFDAIAETGSGHLRIAPGEWLERRNNSLRLVDWTTGLGAALATEGVLAAAPRARARALLSFGNRLAGVEIVGVDPEMEPSTYRFARSGYVRPEEYLAPGDRGFAVIGGALAERLDVEIGDEVMVTVGRDDGEMTREMLVVKGMIEIGNDEIESAICQVTLADIERLAGIGGVGEIVIILADSKRTEEIAAKLSQKVARGDRVITWGDVLPGMAMVTKSKTGYAGMFVSICIVVVMLGIVSSQITAVLERRREFGVLTALGMKGRQVMKLLLVEAVVLGMGGAALGLVLGMPGLYYAATSGFDISWVYDVSDMSMGGMTIDSLWYADIGLWVVPAALAVGLGSTMLASLYPAWLVHRLDPAATIRVAQ
jgi:ABC-type lipoprotein release transport system permease subunit